MKIIDGKIGGLFAALIALFIPSVLFAQETVPPLNPGDTVWILVSAALVLLMTVPALAMFYGGLDYAEHGEAVE